MAFHSIKVALCQIAPVWLNQDKTIVKIVEQIDLAKQKGADLIVFGEALLPGYPFWVELTEGAVFNSELQKQFYSHYVSAGIDIEKGHLNLVKEACRNHQVACYLGCIECAPDRGGKTLYCSMVYIDKDGTLRSVHRKLMPTYEERLVWGIGDGNGLQVHPLNGFKVGGLNCWENWMPMARQALYAQGEDLHVAIWPGSQRNTEQITRFIAKESRSFVVSVSGLMRLRDIPVDMPNRDLLVTEIEKRGSEPLANGGSCVAGPDGEWILEPQINQEGLFLVELDHQLVLQERQNFDLSGHYSRPDVLQLSVNRHRQSVVKFID